MPTPTAVPGATEPPATQATPIDGELVLRVDDINPEMGPAFVIAVLSIYADGSVVKVMPDPTGEPTARYARLTPAGLRSVTAEAGGVFDLRTGTPRGDRLARLEAWLPSGSWEIHPDAALPWIPGDYLLSIRVHDGPQRLFRDVENAWPIETPFETFGGPVPGDDPDPPDRPLRCGVVSLGDALALASAGQLPSPAIPRSLTAQWQLGWVRESAWAELVLEALLPDEPRSCEMARFFP